MGANPGGVTPPLVREDRRQHAVGNFVGTLGEYRYHSVAIAPESDGDETLCAAWLGVYGAVLSNAGEIATFTIRKHTGAQGLLVRQLGPLSGQSRGLTLPSSSS